MSHPKKPIFVLIPGASQNPSHYAHLLHLLQSAGHGTFTGLLPSIGATDPITAADDTHYIRHRLLLPLLDVARQDVILISHSYSGMPASAAAVGLARADRAAEGKSTAVLGQIFIASILPRGGDGSSVIDGFGGQLPPHIQFDVCPLPSSPWPWRCLSLLARLSDVAAGSTNMSVCDFISNETERCLSVL